jgi:hypothetical protein
MVSLKIVFDKVLARVARSKGVYRFEANSILPPMIKHLAPPTLIPGLAFTPIATKAEKPVINAKRSGTLTER